MNSKSAHKVFIFEIGVIMLGMVVIMLNQSIINIALPSIIKQFKIDASTAQWLSTGFMLVSGILVPVSAYLVKRFSYKQLFTVAMSFFTVGSFICAASQNFEILMTGRILQAVGGGIIMPLVMNIFMFSFPPEKRGSAMGVLGIGMILAPAISPSICGYVIEHHNWNVLFVAMGIIAAVVLVLGIIFIDIKGVKETARLNIFGTILSTLGFGTLLYGVSLVGTKGWHDIEVLALIMISVVVLMIFVVTSLKSKNPLLEMRVFKNFTFSYTLLVNMVLSVALNGAMLLLPIYLQSVHHYSPLDAGLLLLPGSLVLGVMGIFTGKLYDKFGIKPLAIFGILVMTVATYLFSKMDLNTSYSYILIMYTIRSFGMSFVMMPMTTAGMVTIEKEQIPHATALQNTMRQISGSIGTAILIVIMSDQAKDYIKDLGKAIKPESVGLAAVHGINQAFFVATIIAGAAFVLSLFLKRPENIMEVKETLPVPE